MRMTKPKDHVISRLARSTMLSKILDCFGLDRQLLDQGRRWAFTSNRVSSNLGRCTSERLDGWLRTQSQNPSSSPQRFSRLTQNIEHRGLLSNPLASSQPPPLLGSAINSASPKATPSKTQQQNSNNRNDLA